MPIRSFLPQDLAALEATKYLYIRSGEHRFIAVWVVVVEGRVIVRSWNDKAKGWYRAFLAEPRGDVKIGEREVPVRGVPLHSKRISDLADEAYAAKYTSKANAKYVKGLKTAKRKATTLELVAV
ncbi:MAG TPA: DUF2255 family protein [Terriglobales bacterium]|nr:DUF2255 family protein [Terriglobales bacterium]